MQPYNPFGQTPMNKAAEDGLVAEFKDKVINRLRQTYDDPSRIIDMIEDDDVRVAVRNGFTVETYIDGLRYY